MSTLPGRLVLLGHPLGHSLSPVFQNAALRAAGIPLAYEVLDVPRSRLAQTLGLLHRERAAGNVTIPYKEDALRACDRLSATARAVGAVNTFWTAVDGARVGDNTDVDGFRAAVRHLVGEPVAGSIAVLGAGGAAAAVLHAIASWPAARVRVYSRTAERALQLVRRLGVTAEVVADAEAAAADAALIVNATPVGRRADDAPPIAVAALPAGAAVLDLAYGPDETSLVREARARGLRAMDGLLMLVEQGAQSFERWFGTAPDRPAMWKALGRDAMMR